MTRRRGVKMGRGQYFEGLKPLGDALAAVALSMPRVHGPSIDPHSLNSPTLDDRLAKREAKLARRARRAGWKVD